jgi:ATP-dependent helicase HrpB
LNSVLSRQRCGRAGRTRPGICWQLWTAHDERSRPDEQTPEIERVDLTAAALQLTAWGETRLERFDWFEAPSVAALARARALLVRLEAIEDRSDGLWVSTSLGKALERLPLHPRLARLIVEGASEGATQEAATCAALLSERSPFKKMSGPQSQPRASVQDSDLLDEMEAIASFERSGRRDFDFGALSITGARNILRVRDQIAQIADATRGANPNGTAQDRADTISRALLKAFPDRLAARRVGDENRAVMVGGRGVTLGRECGVRSARLLLCLDLDDGPTEARIRRASAVDVEWLPAGRLDTQLEYAFNTVDQRVEATTTTRYEGLSISTRPAKPGRDPRSARVLFEAARKSSATALDLEQTDFASFTARVACLGQWMPELGLPDPDDVLLDELLLELCAGRISFEELRKAPLLDAFKARLDWEQLRALDKHAPEKIEIPSGSLITLAYERERPPVLAARIQELFGLSDSPTVAQGRVRVLLHLLAPNMRPQQVTDDLRNFWNTTYTEVRKELRQRYPKHDWPEDPWTASPRRGARRRR